MVKGTMIKIAVVLSTNKETIVVVVPRKIRISEGLPLDIFAAFIAANSKNPDISKMAAITIIPNRRPITLKSMKERASFSVRKPEYFPNKIIAMHPTHTTIVRWTLLLKMAMKEKMNILVAMMA